MIDIVYEDRDVLVVNKQSGLPTVPLSEKDDKKTLLSGVAIDYPEILQIKSRNAHEGGVLHRLDTLTSGLVLIARTQFAYDRLMIEQYNDRIIKTYSACVGKAVLKKEGFEPFSFGSVLSESLVINSYFRPYGPKGAEVRPVLNNQLYFKNVGKPVIYTTETAPEDKFTVSCTLSKGFRHQIRSHLAWAGYPIIGDEMYGGEPNKNFGLCATSITFRSPSEQKMLTITL